MSRITCLLAASAMPACLFVAACGGGGGGGGVGSLPPPAPAPPPPVPPPPPPPAPPPPPPPSGFDTTEFRNSAGIAHADAYTAYQNGATGEGVIVGVVDSGIDVDSLEFTGRISSDSRDFAADRGIDDAGGHGTAVTAILAAARNNRSIVGIAYDSTILTLRTDEPGSCNDVASDSEGCTHPTPNISAAINYAVVNGARVINLSLGGSEAPQQLKNAIANAANAGIIMVISAGNEGETRPGALARVALTPEADGHVIIAGAVDGADQLAEFSNAAGDGRAFYLSALGVRVRSFDQTGAAFLFSGTSFSAPLISGAAALLADAFPNLTGGEIIDILFQSARDAGAAGDDAVYGQGILDLAAAFSPQGATSLPGSGEPVNTISNGTLSAPMGDAGQTGVGAIILDGFDRAFALDLAATIQRMPPVSGLSAAFGDERGLGFAAAPVPGTMVAVELRESRFGTQLSRLALDRGEAERARVIAGMVAARIDPDTAVGFGFSRSGEAVGRQLSGDIRSAFLIAQSGRGDAGFTHRPGTSFALRRRIGDAGITLFAERGDALSRRDAAQGLPLDSWNRAAYGIAGLGLDRRFGSLRIDGGVSYLTEAETFLGARFGTGLGGARGGDSLFADIGINYAAGGGWSIGADIRHGWSVARGSNELFRGGSLRSFSASADVSKSGLFDDADRLSLRVAQPLRVYRGGLDLNLPVSFDYASETAGYDNRRFNLAPEGREVDVEAAYSRLLWGGWLTGNLYYRTDPGHVAALPDDVGAALRYTLGF